MPGAGWGRSAGRGGEQAAARAVDARHATGQAPTVTRPAAGHRHPPRRCHPRPALRPGDAGAAGPRRPAAARRRPPRCVTGGRRLRFVSRQFLGRQHGRFGLRGRVVVGGWLAGSRVRFPAVPSGSSVPSASASLRSCAQLLEAAADLAALLRLVAAHGVEALEVEGGQRVGLLRLVAVSRRADLGRGVEQGHLDPLGPLALPERDGEAAREPGLDLAHRADLGHEAGGQLLQLGRGLVLEDQMVHGGEAVLEGVARGLGLAFRGDGAVRAGAVAAGSLDLGGGAGGGHGGRPKSGEGPATSLSPSGPLS